MHFALLKSCANLHEPAGRFPERVLPIHKVRKLFKASEPPGGLLALKNHLMNRAVYQFRF